MAKKHLLCWTNIKTTEKSSTTSQISPSFGHLKSECLSASGRGFAPWPPICPWTPLGLFSQIPAIGSGKALATPSPVSRITRFASGLCRPSRLICSTESGLASLDAVRVMMTTPDDSFLFLYAVRIVNPAVCSPHLCTVRRPVGASCLPILPISRTLRSDHK